MRGLANADGSGVEIQYVYTYGCRNTFNLAITSGGESAPGQVTSNECTYTASWAAAGFGGGADGYRCEHVRTHRPAVASSQVLVDGLLVTAGPVRQGGPSDPRSCQGRMRGRLRAAGELTSHLPVACD